MTLHRPRLTARFVETAPPGVHDDGRGLRLVVRKSGAKSWILRYQMNYRRRDMGLGRFPETSLALARAKAMELRRDIDAGMDPLAAKKVKALTFKAAAEALIESKGPGWRNAKHRAQWASTLATYAYPTLGESDVKAIEVGDVLDVLRPIWTEKTETASRVRQRIEAVLDYATARKARSGDNPARWKGNLEHLLAAPTKVKRVEHHAALDWREAPAFMADLAKREGTAAKALAFAILTAARSGEVRGMTWGEIDEAADVWTVPAGRIKAGREHRVPLTAAAKALLGERGKPQALVFAAPSDAEKPLSDMTLTAVLRRMERADLTAHGFRSTFRDWAGETTAHPREVIEAALAHQLKDKAEAAYARGDLFVKRRRLMEDWANFLTKPAGYVIPITIDSAMVPASAS
ncbi:MAG: tyrosine-type recombinase/integrase, partial [Geminicoccaceae bacterium]